MSAPLTLAELITLTEKAYAAPSEPILAEMMPPAILAYVQAAPAIWAALTNLDREVEKQRRDIEDFRAALNEYAMQSGSGQLMFDNIQLCLDQIRMRRQKGEG